MPVWFIVLLSLSGSTVACNIVLFLFPHSRVIQLITRPIRARFMMRWSDIDYKQAYAIARMMDRRDRCSHH